MEDMFIPTFLKMADKKSRLPKDPSLAMAYVPMQETLDMYSGEEGLARGTMFPQLDKPFCGRMVRE